MLLHSALRADRSLRIGPEAEQVSACHIARRIWSIEREDQLSSLLVLFKVIYPKYILYATDYSGIHNYNYYVMYDACVITLN